jgi:hypothetical protein
VFAFMRALSALWGAKTSEACWVYIDLLSAHFGAVNTCTVQIDVHIEALRRLDVHHQHTLHSKKDRYVQLTSHPKTKVVEFLS